MLTRSEFMALNKLDTDNFTALKRRNILPLLTSSGRNTYTVSDAFLTRLVLSFCGDFPSTSQVSSRGIIKLIAKDVTNLLGNLPNEIDPAKQIHAGVLHKQFPVGDVGFVGTPDELVIAMVEDAATVKCMTANLTLTAEAFRMTASYNQINIGEF